MADSTVDSDKARHELYNIMRSELSFDQKAEQALGLGKEYLGVENAHFARIDPAADFWKAIVSTDSQEDEFPAGLVLEGSIEPPDGV